MKLIKLLTESPWINLSSEFNFLTNPKYENEDICIIWKNKNTIVIGKNQSLSAEVNQLYAKQHNMNIARRFSGGGSVYQDNGNICFTFIKRNKRKEFEFKKSLNDIIEFLQSINIKAYFSGRNDILVDEKKVSGNAVYFYKNDYMIHGTLLFDVDVEKMVTVLTVDQSKLSSKGIESVRSRVLNLKDKFNGDVLEFEKKLISFFETKYNTSCEYINSENDSDVTKICNETFSNNKWIYERDFSFNFTNSLKTKNGLLTLKLQTENNTIKDIEFFSDSLIALNIKEIQNIFINQKYEIDNIKNICNKIDLNTILEDLTIDELINLFFKI